MSLDLTTHYLGLTLRNPLVVASSPLSDELDNLRKMEDAGAGAVVLHSLFEEQLRHERLELHHHLTQSTYSFPEALSFFPEPDEFSLGPEEYLEHIRRAKQAVRIPVIASINGASPGDWVKCARQMQDAGADAIELNIYYVATDPEMSSTEVERMYVDVLREVKSSITIPVAIKVAPFFTAFAHMARQLEAAGADSIVLFNRFYQPDLDLEQLKVVPRLVLSESQELRLPLRWVAILYGRVQTDFAITSGVHTGEDVLKAMMAGARVVQIASEFLQRGAKRIGELVGELEAWMVEKDYDSIQQMQGSMSQRYVAEPAAFERANYMKTLASWRPDPTGTLA